MSEYECILYRAEHRIARVTFNRPEVRNAMNLQLRHEMIDALKRAERDDEVSVVVLDGAGPSFCSGYDMSTGNYLASRDIVSPLFDGWSDQYARKALADWFTIWDLLKPVICKVQGSCLAGGTEIMSMCDIVFAADDARIGYPAMRAQSTPDAAYFPWKMSMARAKYLQITGNIISGKQAADWGWITKSFPAAELDEVFDREVAAIASIAPDLLAANKLCLNQTYEAMGFRSALYAATPWHYLSGKIRPNAQAFRKIANESGIKVAVAWRDEAFKDIDFFPKK